MLKDLRSAIYDCRIEVAELVVTSFSENQAEKSFREIRKGSGARLQELLRFFFGEHVPALQIGGRFDAKGFLNPRG